MSFIGDIKKGVNYHPGYFLAREECERKTREIAQNHAQVVTGGDGSKHVPMGAFYPANNSSTVEGIVYEDVDVTTGAMPGPVVLNGTVYLDRLPAAPESGVQSALEGKGFTFITSAPKAIRPEYPTKLTTLTVSFAEGASGKTTPTATGFTLRTGDSYKFKLGTGTAATNAPKVVVGDILTTGWTAWDGESDITIAAGDDGKYATIAVVNEFGEAIAAGSGAVDRKS